MAKNHELSFYCWLLVGAAVLCNITLTHAAAIESSGGALILSGKGDTNDTSVGLVKNETTLASAAEPTTTELPTEAPEETTVEPTIGLPAESQANQAAELPTDSAVEPPVESPVEPPAELPVEPQANQTVELSTDPAVEPPAELPVEPPAELPVEPQANQTVELPTDPAVESPLEPPAELPVEPQANQTAELPADPAVEPPVELATDAPATDGATVGSGSSNGTAPNDGNGTGEGSGNGNDNGDASNTTEAPTTTTATPTTPAAPLHECTAAGNFVDSENCTRYISCQASPTNAGSFEQLTLNCPAPLVYSPAYERCTRDLSACTANTAGAEDLNCTAPGIYGNLLGDGSDYYLCVPSIVGGYHKYRVRCSVGDRYEASLGGCWRSDWAYVPFSQRYEDHDIAAIRAELKQFKQEEKLKLKAQKQQEKQLRKQQKELEKLAKKAAKEEAKKAAKEAANGGAANSNESVTSLENDYAVSLES